MDWLVRGFSFDLPSGTRAIKRPPLGFILGEGPARYHDQAWAVATMETRRQQRLLTA